MEMAKVTKPNIKIGYHKRVDDLGYPIINDYGNQSYRIVVYGISKYKFTTEANNELRELLKNYEKIIDQKTSLNNSDLKLLKLQIELWFNEKIENNQVVEGE